MNTLLRTTAVLAAATAMLFAAGCATQTNSASVYSASQTQREQTVRYAVVESAREVVIDRGQQGTGTVAGAVVGGVAGSSIGGRRENIAGAVLGAVAGGVVGQAIEGSANKRKGVEITLRYDNGDIRAIVQEADDQVFNPGDRVRVLFNGMTSRVVKG
jgi:outer membrane lipoprotein SlyB